MRYAQRLHIIRSLDTLIYQLIAVSFLLSPSLISFAIRIFFQFLFTRPRDLDPNRSLRFWCALNLFFNCGSLWAHAWEGAAKGRSVLIDFIGQTGTASPLHLLSLDITIIFLNTLLISIAYETTLHAEKDFSAPDPLLPSPSPFNTSNTFPSLSLSPSPSPSSSTYPPPPQPTKHSQHSQLILDLHLTQILSRLLNPPPPPPPPSTSLSRDLLPLPNTMTTGPWRVPTPFSMLAGGGARTRALQRARVRAAAVRAANNNINEEEEEGEGGREGREGRRIPGGLDVGDGS
ncbi:hypothetical protein BC629DRAFT_243671 [Irpex lacteus]|nr:hypothetical protein BC629DRAFT_243671 [Irpex lacteus]